MTFIRQPAWKPQQYLGNSLALFKSKNKSPCMQIKEGPEGMPQMFLKYTLIIIIFGN